MVQYSAPGIASSVNNTHTHSQSPNLIENLKTNDACIWALISCLNAVSREVL